MTALQQLESIAEKIHDDKLTWPQKFKVLKNFIQAKKTIEEQQIKKAYDQGKLDVINMIPYAKNQDDYYNKISR